jgi:hypothetical protein
VSTPHQEEGMMPPRMPDRRTARHDPRRVSVTTIAIWVFVIVEAIGIGYALAAH